MCSIAYAVLIVCCGLLAKWLRVSVRVRAGAMECTSCTVFSPFFISVVNTCLRWFGILVRYIVSVIAHAMAGYLWVFNK